MDIIKFRDYSLNEINKDDVSEETDEEKFFEDEKIKIIEKFQDFEEEYMAFLSLISSKYWRGAPGLPQSFEFNIMRMELGGQREFDYAIKREVELTDAMKKKYPDIYKKFMKMNKANDFNL